MTEARTVVAIGVLLAFAALAGLAQQRAPAPDLRWVRVPAGSFQMGCVPADDACDEHERPRHRVALSRSFDLMATEITVAQYEAFVAASDRELPRSPDFEQAENHPVVYLSWDDAAAFCKWAGGRLPTEAEWEYAARGGKDGLVYWWGEEVSHEWSNYGADECCEGLAEGRDQWVNTAPVGSFPANGFGLYDMAGNVWEWVADWFDPGFYSQSPLTDPAGPAGGFGRVARGGSWLNFPQVVRTSLRLVFAPSGHTSNIGGRCARDVGPIRLARR